MAVRVGTVLAGRYQITEPIATGGMGEVWQARDRTLGRVIAVKVLKSEYTGDSSFLIRFRNEARHTAALSHPNIASVYDYGETTEDGQRLAYLIMEFVEGKPLVQILAERGRLTAEQTLDVLGQAGDGLSAAHAAGMVHRDIKPGNLLVRPDGVVKLTDFGIAYARDAAPLTRTGMVVGTAQYLSPEQAQGHVVTAASDVYSLGVLGYECVAGVRPFDGESQVAIALAQINRPPPPLPADVPMAVRQLIDRALSKDAAARFPDGGAFAAAVREVAAGRAVPPPTGVTQVIAADGAATTVIPVAEAATGVIHSTAPRTMPPLHGPPTGGGATPVRDWDGADGGDDDPAGRRRTRLLWAAAAAVLLALAVAGFIVLQSGGDERDADGAPALTGATPSGSSSAPASPTGTDLVTIDPDSYIGESLDDVTDLLEAEDLMVDAREADADQLAAAGVDLAEDDVAAVSPDTTQVDRGSTVTLYYATEDYTAPSEETSPAPTDGGGQQSTSAPTSAGGGAPGGGAPAPGTSAAPTSRTPVVPAPTGGSSAPASSAPATTATTAPPATTSTSAPATTGAPTTTTESTAVQGDAVAPQPAP
ncbi:serine/threonine protein kinase [Modestobacter muralis]|uniref:non-specific serine/threonine protein kinase n=1 Tax=Modestobacter muralis TaxID=1608614 RepID=A0A6P0ESJ7_9ACTN|nr:serine/threonine-protein kinase [Modestobacter muralis]NEK93820.1 serine/threonine protein kinase [Modestobacter muralis]NEN50587.1 serine/threonine protein kinase [Modestobacter muralis]